jgi:hypothetical protein
MRMITTNSQKGFSAVEAILTIVFIGLIAGGGWFVYQRDHAAAKPVAQTKTAQAQKAASTTSNSATYKAPAGYLTYADRARGFSFAYPQEYGTFTASTDASGNAVLTSNKVTTSDGFGANGSLVVTTYPNAGVVIGSRKYGPEIQLQDKGWVIVKEGTIPGKVGDLYTGADGKVPPSTQHGKLTVYTLIGGDEGVEADTYAFIARGRLVTVQLPPFVDQGYAQPKHTDKTGFNAMLKNVLDSIQPLAG